jgi:peroxiredoxin
MNKNKVWLAILAVTLISNSFLFSHGDNKDEKSSLKVSLTINENIKAWSGFMASLDENKINKTLVDRPVKKLLDIHKKYTVGLTYEGTYFLFLKNENEGLVELIIDTNRNDDFTDEKPFIFEQEGSLSVKILRKYEKYGKVWLPYDIEHNERNGKDGISMSSHYRAEGKLDVVDKKILVALWDMNCNGKFDDDFRHGSNFSIDINGDGKLVGRNEHYKSSELIPIGGHFFEASEIAEDGSSITFVKSELRHVKVGELASDFELRDNKGNKFHISDLQGKVVIMNFWASWCKPCIEKFPEIRKLYDKYDKDSFKFIGINTDSPSRFKEAKEIIKKFDFAWPQVMLGDPDYSPLWRSYSRVSDRASSISLIVVIDKLGIVRYAHDASKTLEEIKPILEEIK